MVVFIRPANTFNLDSRSLVWIQDGLCGNQPAAKYLEVMLGCWGRKSSGAALEAARRLPIHGWCEVRCRLGSEPHVCTPAVTGCLVPGPLRIGAGGHASRPLHDETSTRQLV